MTWLSVALTVLFRTGTGSLACCNVKNEDKC